MRALPAKVLGSPWNWCDPAYNLLLAAPSVLAFCWALGFFSFGMLCNDDIKMEKINYLCHPHCSGMVMYIP